MYTVMLNYSAYKTVGTYNSALALVAKLKLSRPNDLAWIARKRGK